MATRMHKLSRLSGELMTILLFTYLEDITLDADEEIYEVAGRTRGMGLD
jgi:hypothetical protein